MIVTMMTMMIMIMIVMMTMIIMIMIIMIMIMIAMVMIISSDFVFISPGMPPMNNFKPSPDTDKVIIFEELLKPASISAKFFSIKFFP